MALCEPRCKNWAQVPDDSALGTWDNSDYTLELLWSIRLFLGLAMVLQHNTPCSSHSLTEYFSSLSHPLLRAHHHLHEMVVRRRLRQDFACSKAC